MKTNLPGLMIVLLIALAAQAQKIQIPNSWDALAKKADQVTNVTLDKNMLGLAAKFMNDNEAESKQVEQLVSKLNGIYVRSLEFKKPGEFTEADLQPIRAQLSGPEWTRIVDVNDKSSKETVTIYMRQVSDHASGMVVLAAEPTELTFVQLDGTIDPADLAALSGNFGIPKGVGATSSASPVNKLKKPTQNQK